MLNNILSDAVKSNNFKIVESQECIQIFERIEGEAKRFIILYEAPAIQNVDSLNELIVNSIPEKLKEEPAFNKNTDLIVISGCESVGNCESVTTRTDRNAVVSNSFAGVSRCGTTFIVLDQYITSNIGTGAPGVSGLTTLSPGLPSVWRSNGDLADSDLCTGLGVVALVRFRVEIYWIHNCPKIIGSR